MKIKMQGSELKKVDIEFLSLVRRGANRAPFKVIKAEDGGVTGDRGMLGAVTKFFQMSEPVARVVAVFVDNQALAKAAPNLADAGFDLSAHETVDGCTLFKFEGFDTAKEVIMVKSEPSIGFAVANVGAFADTFCGSLSFDPSVAQTGFYPGPNEAMKAMQVAVNVEKADSTNTLDAFHAYTKSIAKALPQAIAKFEAAQRGFGGGTTEITEVAKAASVLAAAILKDAHPGRGGVKEEAKAQAGSSSDGENGNSSTTTSELPGSSDDSPDDEAQKKAAMAKTGDGNMALTAEELAKKAKEASTTSTTSSTSEEYNFNKSAKPIVVKGSDGTLFNLAVSKDGKIVKYTAGAKIPEGHTTMTEEWEQKGSDGDSNFNTDGNNKGKSADPDTKADNELMHTGAGGLKKEDFDAGMQTLTSLVTALAKSVEAQGEVIKAQATRLEAVEKTAATAVKKADDKAVVHVTPNYDSAFESLGHRRMAKAAERRTPAQIAKAEYPDSLWEGTMSAFDHRIPGVESV